MTRHGRTLVGLLMLAGCGNHQPPELAHVGALRTRAVTLTTREGPERSVEAEEGWLRVPERWQDSSGPPIRLHFYRYAATTSDPGAPIVYLAGGPGGSGTISSLGDRFPLFQALRGVADVIAWDQRGTYGTDPYLVCPASYDYPLREPGDPQGMLPILEEYARRCVSHWESRGIDLAAYHTLASADDLEALRRALGTDRLTLWGISYGTHLALAYIRRYPDRVDRAILAGIEGPDQTLKLPSNLDRVLARVDSLVRLEPELRRRIPDLLGTVSELLDRIERDPVTVEIPDPEGGGSVSVGIGRHDLQALLSDLLGDDEQIDRLPAGVAAVAAGDYSLPARALARQRRGRRRLAMSISMDCASGASAGRLRRIEEERRNSLLGDAVNFPFPAICEFWPHTDLGADYRVPVRSEVPVLFISGTLDARTPPANAEEVRAGFPNSRHLLIEGGTHDDDLFLASPSILDEMTGFLKVGSVERERIPVRRQFARDLPID